MSKQLNPDTQPTFSDARKQEGYYFIYPTHWFCVSTQGIGISPTWLFQLFAGGPKGECVAANAFDSMFPTKEAALEAAWEAYQKEVGGE